MLLIVVQPAFSLSQSRDAPRLNLPQTVVRKIHFLEPVAALFEYTQVSRRVSEIAQRLRAFPNRHVHNEERIVRVNNVCGVARASLRAKRSRRSGLQVG